MDVEDAEVHVDNGTVVSDFFRIASLFDIIVCDLTVAAREPAEDVCDSSVKVALLDVFRRLGAAKQNTLSCLYYICKLSKTQLHIQSIQPSMHE